MSLLYNNLQVDKRATLETINKSYKTIAYACILERDTTRLQNINLAYQILKDKHKREFYNKFGDSFIPNLSNPTESFFISRFFTSFNIAFLLLFSYLLATNYFFIGLLAYFNPIKSTIFKFIPLIIAPLFLLPVAIRSSYLISPQNPYISKFLQFSWISIFFSATIAVICLKLPIYFLIFSEFSQFFSIYFTAKQHGFGILKTFLGFLIKSTVLSLYYVPYFKSLKYFLPCLIFLGLFLIHPLLPVILAAFILPNCLGIFLTECTSHSKIGLTFHIIHSLFGILCIFIGSLSFLQLFEKFKPRAILGLLEGAQI